MYLSRCVVNGVLAGICATLSAICSAPAYAQCGFAENVLTGQKLFSATPFGTLAIKSANSYVLLKQGNCTSYNSSNGHLTFVINHLSASLPQSKAFLATQVTFVQFTDKQNKTFLFRNQQAEGGWLKDRSTIPYRSLHDAAPADFSKDLDGSQAEFDKKYRDASGRTWNDEIPTDVNDGKYTTWSAKRTFYASKQVTGGAGASSFGARAQNYLISFTTRTATAGATDKVVDFNVEIGSAQCMFLRTSGSDNVAAELDGEYVLALDGDSRCESLAKEFGAQNWFHMLFSFFFNSSGN